MQIPIRDPAKSKSLERKYRALVIEDGLRHTAEALEGLSGAGSPPRPPPHHSAGRGVPTEIAHVAHLATMEGRYRGLLEAAPDAMVVVDQDGQIVLVNAQTEKQFGYDRNELLGQRVTSIIPKGFAERLIADGTSTAAEALAQQIGNGIELIGQRKDRSPFPI